MDEDAVTDALVRLAAVTEAAGVPFAWDQVTYEWQAAPHRQPSRLPAGTCAIYAFFCGDRCLKCGKAGPKSAARYTSQHYNPGSAPSTLAAALLARGSEVGISGLEAAAVGGWIMANLDRVSLLFPDSTDAYLLSFFEAFLHLQWRPVFEGHR